MTSQNVDLQAYNEAADRLALLPVTAKRAEGTVFEARLDRSGANAADMVSADLKVVLACPPAASHGRINTVALPVARTKGKSAHFGSPSGLCAKTDRVPSRCAAPVVQRNVLGTLRFSDAADSQLSRPML